MAEERLGLDHEVAQIFEHIQNGENFLLSGGAGSGKTYSLVQVIKKTIADNPTAKIACMTYTNAAVREIEERVGHQNLSVTTIHGFLWDNIKSFQKELKQATIALMNDETLKKPTDIDGEVPNSYFNHLNEGIQYKEYLRVREGIISHDEILILANYMFQKHRLLCDILKDKFKFIFIDEYQDTSPLVVEIFLVHLKQSTKMNIIGFFGDSMQAIYDDGIGDLNKYITSKDVVVVHKTQNRRNPQLVIDLANKLRIDGLQQEPSTDAKAPNMEDQNVKCGSIKFLHSIGKTLDVIKHTEHFSTWNFNDARQTKELNLTHNLIAPKAGFLTLMDIYDKDRIIELKDQLVKRIKDGNITVSEIETFGDIVDQLSLSQTNVIPKVIRKFIDEHKDLYQIARSYPFVVFRNLHINKEQLIDDKKQDERDEKKKGSKRDKLIKHLFKIQTNIHLYNEKRYNEFIRKTDFKINSIAGKQNLKVVIQEISQSQDLTIEETINIADEKGICKKDDNFNQFVTDNQYLYNRIKSVKYQEFINLFNYLEGFTPFSTQHKIKGAEFDNVLVILDNGRWNNYNFDYLFTIPPDKKNVLERTQKIFYVCCTRAKENLIVYFDTPNPTVLSKAKEWFGVKNVIEI